MYPSRLLACWPNHTNPCAFLQRSRRIADEVAFRCLSCVHPLTLAVGGMFRYIPLVVISVIVLESKLTPQMVVGMYITTVGVMLYRLADRTVMTRNTGHDVVKA